MREFATLTFTWPLSRSDADPEAVKLFEEAVAARAQWKDFPGFTATIDGNIDGRPIAGDVTVAADGSVTIDAADEPTADWVREQLESITRHRVASEAASDANRPVLRFADEESDHPLGRLLEFDGGQFASSYRVRDRQIMVVNRHFGEQDMTITVLDNERTATDRFLPRSYTVQYWDAEDRPARSHGMRARPLAARRRVRFAAKPHCDHGHIPRPVRTYVFVNQCTHKRCSPNKLPGS